ncbi:MAG: glycosyltransferase family 4 protein [Spongiibacteraceae bacterium]
MNILLIGAYPPPTGGNSVHIKRLKETLSAKGCKCTVIDIYGNPTPEIRQPDIHRIGPAGFGALLKCISLIKKTPHDVIHFHVSAMERFLYAGHILTLFAESRAKKILTIHSGQFVDTYQSLPKIKQKVLSRLFHQFTHIIVVNSGQKRLLEDIGVTSDKVSVIPAYIPPELTSFPEAETILNALKEDDRTLIVSSGYGEPLYGYHRIVGAIASNPVLTKKTSLLLCLYNRYDQEYMSQIESSLRKLESVQIIRDLNSEQFAYLLSKSNMYIRATDSDGDAVAIREAAHFGLSVIASNIGERPEYCRLFNVDDTISLGNQILESISHPTVESDASERMESTVDKIFKIYAKNKK